MVRLNLQHCRAGTRIELCLRIQMLPAKM